MRSNSVAPRLSTPVRNADANGQPLPPIRPAEPELGRRDFFRGAVRYAAAAFLAGGTAMLVLRRQRGPSLACQRRIVCSSCGLFDQCALPQAQASRGGRP